MRSRTKAQYCEPLVDSRHSGYIIFAALISEKLLDSAGQQSQECNAFMQPWLVLV